ncbi:MAG: hypothetical protein JNG85_11640, partial [Spirochaetaceae bacterium]|nr:hypothetical protein [Spirochaetaceae bacterium]
MIDSKNRTSRRPSPLNRLGGAGALALLILLALGACSKSPADSAKAAPPKVAVFVPGLVSGSPIYEQLVAGATKAVAEMPGATLKVVEAGFNQAEWLDQLSAIAATGEF